MTVSVHLPEYLFQWVRFHYGSPVTPAKGSPLASFLRAFLRHKSSRPNSENADNIRGAVNFGSFELRINIPHFPGRDPLYYNYLSPVAESQLRDLFRSLFDVQLFTDMSRFANTLINKNDFIYAWLDSNGIDPTEGNWLAVSKRLQLLQRRSSDAYRKSRKRSS